MFNEYPFIGKFNSKQCACDWISFSPTEQNTCGPIYDRCVHMFANRHWTTHNVWVTRAKVAKDGTCRFLLLLTRQVKQHLHPRPICDGNNIWTTTVSVSLYAWLREWLSVWRRCHSHAAGMHARMPHSRCTLVWDSSKATLFVLNHC